MTHVHIAVPCYGGLMSAHTARGLVFLTSELARAGIGWSLDQILHESLVQRARNILTANFLKNQQATHLLFIDADIKFRPQDVLAMLGLDLPMVCGAYPKKSLSFEDIKAAIAAGHPDPMARGTDFAINATDGDVVDVHKGCVPIKEAATGFLLIQRHVMMDMVRKYAETLYFSDSPGNYGEPQWALFDCGIQNGRYLSEDYLFSHRWTDMGGTVWLYMLAKLEHVGSYTYRGDLLKVFSPVPHKPAEPETDIDRATAIAMAAAGWRKVAAA